MKTLLSYENRRLGWSARLAPVVAVAVALAAASAAGGTGADRPQVTRILLAGLEALLPLAVAVAAVAVVATERCADLHLSLPTRYPTTLARRLGLLAGAACGVALLFSAGLWLAGFRTVPLSPLLWAAPTFWLAALAVATGVVSRSLVTATSVTSAVWLAEQFFASAFAAREWLRPLFLFPVTRLDAYPGWATDRLLLVASAVPLVVLVTVLLRRPERLLTEEEA